MFAGEIDSRHGVPSHPDYVETLLLECGTQSFPEELRVIDNQNSRQASTPTFVQPGARPQTSHFGYHVCSHRESDPIRAKCPGCGQNRSTRRHHVVHQDHRPPGGAERAERGDTSLMVPAGASSCVDGSTDPLDHRLAGSPRQLSRDDQGRVDPVFDSS